jgi:hypothetical protein
MRQDETVFRLSHHAAQSAASPRRRCICAARPPLDHQTPDTETRRHGDTGSRPSTRTATSTEPRTPNPEPSILLTAAICKAPKSDTFGRAASVLFILFLLMLRCNSRSRQHLRRRARGVTGGRRGTLSDESCQSIFHFFTVLRVLQPLARPRVRGEMSSPGRLPCLKCQAA